MLQDNQMDIHVRFWDSEKNQAETRFPTLMFLKKAIADDLRQELSKENQHVIDEWSKCKLVGTQVSK